MDSESKEFYVKATWGNIALVSWYEGPLEPVLMVHGRQDSAATFIPLVSRLPKTRRYVAVDLPGNGRSDSFPKGLMMSRYHFIGAIDYVIRHLGWKSFVYLGHSMGCEIGLYFNAIRPGLISRFIHIDAGPSFQRLQQPDHVYYYMKYYHKFYSNYQRYMSDNPKVYTKKQAVTAVMKARQLTEEQAETIISRNLIPIGEDKYRFSWDTRMKFVVPQNSPNEMYTYLFTSSLPTIFISMSNGYQGHLRGKDGADQLIRNLMAAANFRKIDLEGEHDHHITNPDEIANYVTEFLTNGNEVKCKI